MVEYLNLIFLSVLGLLLICVMDKGRGFGGLSVKYFLVDWMGVGGIFSGGFLKEVSILELGLKKESDMYGCGGESEAF